VCGRWNVLSAQYLAIGYPLMEKSPDEKYINEGLSVLLSISTGIKICIFFLDLKNILN
jgi:hypothetical protein